jgi:integrase
VYIVEPRAGFEPATSALPTQAFDEILGKFERFCGVDLQLSPVTVKDHSSGICRVLRRIQKEYCEVTKEDLRAYLFEFKQNHAPATVAGVIKTLRVFYRDFIGSPELVDSFKFPNIPYRPKIIPSRDDLQKFYSCLDSSFAEALFLFYASSGLRKCEVLSLNVNDIDFEKRMIVPSNHIGITKCSYISFFNRESEEALNRLDLAGDKLFNVSDRQYKKLWKSAQRKSGLHITAKRLRDWFCCEMGSLGVSDRYIDAFCGRTPKSVLARHYTDYNPERLKKIYENANLMVLN